MDMKSYYSTINTLLSLDMNILEVGSAWSANKEVGCWCHSYLGSRRTLPNPSATTWKWKL